MGSRGRAGLDSNTPPMKLCGETSRVLHQLRAWPATGGTSGSIGVELSRRRASVVRSRVFPRTRATRGLQTPTSTQGAHMRPITSAVFLVCAAALAAPARGQASAPAPATARTVVAATKLPMLGETPVHFKAVSVTLPAGTGSSVSSADGILYQLSGSTEVSIGGEVRTLSPGEG